MPQRARKQACRGTRGRYAQLRFKRARTVALAPSLLAAAMGKNKRKNGWKAPPTGARKGVTTGDGRGSNWAVEAKAREDASATRAALENRVQAIKKRARDEDSKGTLEAARWIRFPCAR